MELLELLLRYVALPVVIGIFTIIAVVFYDSRKSSRQDVKENRLEQIRGARKTMENVIADAERLSSLMRYHAWAVAWRRRRPEGLFETDLVQADAKKWEIYDGALENWRKKRIQHKAAIAFYFGRRDAASRLFKLLDASIDKLSFELWFIFHNNPANPNVFLQSFVEDIGQPYDTVFNVIMTSLDNSLTREQEETVHSTTAKAFDELQSKVERLCFEMSESIRNENVGNLRIVGSRQKTMLRSRHSSGDTSSRRSSVLSASSLATN